MDRVNKKFDEFLLELQEKLTRKKLSVLDCEDIRNMKNTLSDILNKQRRN